MNTCENFHIFFWCSPLFSVIDFFFHSSLLTHHWLSHCVWGDLKTVRGRSIHISEKQVVYSLRRIVSRHRPTRRHTYLICEDTRSSDAQISTWRKRDDCLQLQNFSVAVARDMVRPFTIDLLFCISSLTKWAGGRSTLDFKIYFNYFIKYREGGSRPFNFIPFHSLYTVHEAIKYHRSLVPQGHFQVWDKNNLESTSFHLFVLEKSRKTYGVSLS